MPWAPCRAHRTAAMTITGPGNETRPVDRPPGTNDTRLAKPRLGGLGLGAGAASLFRHAASLGALGKHLGDALHRAALVELLDGGNLASHAVERRFIELPFGIGLLRLRLRTVQVAHDLGDRDQITRIDLRLVFLRPTAPHGALDA